jgi:hypothetical protein
MTHEPAPPERVDETAAQRVPERRWWPALLVTALILALLGSGQLVRGPTAAAAPIRVGEVVVQPRPGWTPTTQTPTFVRLQQGPAALDIVATAPAYTGPVGIAAAYIDQVLRPSLAQFTSGEPVTTTVAGGVPAVRVPYVGVTNGGVAIEGVLVAASAPRAAVVFDASAPKGLLAGVAIDVGAMIDQAAIAP